MRFPGRGTPASRALAWLGLSLALAGPAAAMEFEPPAVLCDRLAGNRHDPDFRGEGVHYGEVDVVRAEAACRAAVAAFPDERRYRYQLGRVHAEMGDWFNAYDNYQQAAAMGSAIALNGIGVMYDFGDGFEQDTTQAAEYYRRASEQGLAVGFANLAWLTEAGDGVTRDLAEALRLYRRAADLGDAWSLVSIGYLYSDGTGVPKDVAEAERLFREAMDDQDGHVVAYAGNALAWLRADEGGDLAEAEAWARDAVAAEPNDDDMRASYLDTLGMVLHRAGRNDEALPHARESVLLDPLEPGPFARLGDIYAALGRGVEAKAAWRQALELPEPGIMTEPHWDPAAIRAKIDATP